MVHEGFCTVCQRSVSIVDDEESVCPVCSSPLISTESEAGIDPPEEADPATEPSEQYLG